MPLDIPFYGIKAIDLTFNQKMTVLPVTSPSPATRVNYNYLPAIVPSIVGINTLEWRLGTPLASATGYDTINLGLSGHRPPVAPCRTSRCWWAT